MGATRGFFGKPVHQIGRDRALGQHAGSLRRDAEEVGRPRPVYEQKRPENRRDENGATGVGFVGLLEGTWIRLA